MKGRKFSREFKVEVVKLVGETWGIGGASRSRAGRS